MRFHLIVARIFKFRTKRTCLCPKKHCNNESNPRPLNSTLFKKTFVEKDDGHKHREYETPKPTISIHIQRNIIPSLPRLEYLKAHARI